MENNTYKLTDKDILLIDTFEDATRRGFYINGKTVFELYNKVFNANLRPTSCGTCIKHRIKDLIQYKNQVLEALKKQEEQSVEQEISENKSTTEENTPIVEPKKKGRPKKTS